MSGRDVPTRQKTLSVAFSVIMMLSMVAMGVAGFAGSAAAGSNDIDAGSASFVAETANSDDTAVDHIIRVNVSGTDVGDKDIGGGSIKVDYGEEIGLAAVDTSEITSNSDVTVFTGGSQVSGGTPSAITTSGNQSITIPLDSLTEDLSSGGDDVDIITIKITGSLNGATDLINPSGDNQLGVTIGDDDTSDPGSATNSATFSTTPQMDGDAPISADIDGSGNNVDHFHTLESVVDAGTVFVDELTADTNGDIVTVNDDLNVTDDPADQLHNGLTVQATNVTIEGSGNPTVAIDNNKIGTSITNFIDLDNNDEVTIEGLSFDLVSGSGTAIIENGGTGSVNATVTENTFSNFDSTTVDIRPANNDDSNVDTLEISGNTFQSDTGGAVNVDLQDITDSSNIDQVVIDNNEVDFTSGTAVTIGTSGSTASLGDIDLTSNDIDGNENDVTAIQLTSNQDITADVNVDGGTIDGVNTGLDTSTGGQAVGDFMNITSLTAVNVSDHGGSNSVALDLTGGPGATITVDGLTVDSSSDATAVDVDDSGSDLTVTGSSINDTNDGIVVSDVSGTAEVSDTTVDNSAGTAIDLDGPDAGGAVNVAVNESTSIDQATTGIDVDISTSTGSTVDVNNVDVNGTSSGVDITGLTDDSTTFVNVTDSTFTNNDGAGLNLSDPGTAIVDTGLNVHFNTFEDNDVGVGVDDGANNFNGVLNVTFNDFVSNTNAGLDVVSVNNGQVNANYSWWDNRDSSRIVGPYTPQNAESQLPIPRRVYSYTRLHTGGQP